ncbi:hypothetical protein EMIT0P291_90203 [Pseudomonas sp. IT-P291]
MLLRSQRHGQSFLYAMHYKLAEKMLLDNLFLPSHIRKRLGLSSSLCANTQATLPRIPMPGK